MKILILVLTVISSTTLIAQVCSNNICESGETFDNCPRDCWLDTIQIFLNEGGRVDWDKSGSNKIAFDKKDSLDFYDVYSIYPNGSGLFCITCNATGVPQNHCGNPAWSPNGEWIVFQAEHEHLDTTVSSNDAEPGKGTRNNLYAYNSISQEFTQLTFLADSQHLGVLHPHFSHDCTKLSWSQMYDSVRVVPFGQLFGAWELKTADFIIDSSGVPSLQNINTYQPFAEVFYENHGFSPNDSSLLFSSNEFLWVMPPGNNNLFTLNLQNQNTVKLTDTAYNEHAQYTPDGTKILWGTSKNNANKGMDYWLMNNDGSNMQRLTYFNDSTQYEYLPEAYAVDMSFSADGLEMVGYVQTNLLTQLGKTYHFSFLDNAIGINDQMQLEYAPIVYPNPTNGNIKIEFHEVNSSVELTLHNMYGQTIYHNTYENQKEIDIDFNGSCGVYFLKIKTEDEDYQAFKIFKQ